VARSLITGITGQDGSYLAEFLLAKGYEVYGLVRRLSTPNNGRIEHILPDIDLIQGDLLDQSSLERAIDKSQPDEVYNLAAMSHVGLSFEQPTATGEYNGLGVVRLLEAIRLSGGDIKFYQASTSELYGNALVSPQNEVTPFYPRSPYGCSKLYAHTSVANYREAYGMFACSGILFNHESPRRGLAFVTRKISNTVARIKYGQQKTLDIGNINASRDWGYAGDYVEAMWLMLQQEQPKDYVIATGKTHTVGEFISLACENANLPGAWHDYVNIDPTFFRPADVHFLIGDSSLAKKELGWTPKVNFEQLVQMMVEADIQLVAKKESNNYEYSSR
jgi:GDPmannose 4,6-dehydratase